MPLKHRPLWYQVGHYVLCFAGNGMALFGICAASLHLGVLPDSQGGWITPFIIGSVVYPTKVLFSLFEDLRLDYFSGNQEESEGDSEAQN